MPTSIPTILSGSSVFVDGSSGVSTESTAYHRPVGSRFTVTAFTVASVGRSRCETTGILRLSTATVRRGRSFVELATGLTVGERMVVSRALPPNVADAVAVLLEIAKSREVVIQPLNDLLKHFGVDRLQFGPPLLEVR